MKIREVRSYKADIPFKRKFVISHMVRESSESVFVKIMLDDGTIGWGESLPRHYVTGETQESVINVLNSHFIPLVAKWDITSYEELFEKLKKVKAKKEYNCALCAIELALLDAYGKHFKRSVADLFGDPRERSHRYSGVVSAEDKFLWHLIEMKLFGLENIKVKVGRGDDLKRLRLVRKMFGHKIDLRIDANCAWTVSETHKMIKEMDKLGIDAIEQPVKTIDEMNQLAPQIDIPLVADESLCTLKDAKKLDEEIIFDIRISKCGGLLKSLEIHEYAKKHGIKCMLGCQVGESGILSAAGRHYACGTDDLKYLEGSYNHFLLKKDVTKEDLTFKKKGVGKPIRGYGLGVHVKERIVRKYSV